MSPGSRVRLAALVFALFLVVPADLASDEGSKDQEPGTPPARAEGEPVELLWEPFSRPSAARRSFADDWRSVAPRRSESPRQPIASQAPFLTLALADESTRDLVLSENASLLYVQERGGVLRELALPRLIETRLLDLDTPARSLARSKKGLVVTLPSLQQLLVIDESTLRPTQRVVIPGLETVLASPGSSRVLVSLDQSTGQALVDLEEGKVLGILKGDRLLGPLLGRKPNPHAAELRALAMSPDGLRVVISLSGKQLVAKLLPDRLRVSMPALAQEGKPIFGPRGQYLAWVTNLKFPGSPPLDSSTGVYVYETRDLSVPVVAFGSRAFAFDPARSCLWAWSAGKLSRVTPRGAVLESFFHSSQSYVSELAATPSGILFYGDDRILTIMPVTNGGTVSGDPGPWLGRSQSLPPEAPGRPLPGKTEGLRPSPGRGNVFAEPYEDGGRIWTELVAEPGEKVVDVEWSAGGDGIFLLTRNGDLSRIDPRDGREAVRLELATWVRGLVRSGDRLLIHLPGLQEILQLDAETLRPLRSARTVSVESILAASESPVAFAVQQRWLDAARSRPRLVPMSLTEPWAVTLDSPALLDLDFNAAAAVSPDGKRLYAILGPKELHVFESHRGEWRLRRSPGDGLFERLDDVVIHPDGALLAARGFQEQTTDPNRTGRRHSGWLIFAADQLAEPRLVLDRNERHLAFHPTEKTIYLYGEADGARVFNLRGGEIARFQRPARHRHAMSELAFAPDGNSFLIRVDGTFYHVTRAPSPP